MSIEVYKCEYFHILEVNEPKLKTNKYYIYSNYGDENEEAIGIVKWYPNWRKYCFFPEDNCVWDTKCLYYLTSFIDKLNLDYKNKGVEEMLSKLSWKVLRFDFNSRKIEYFDIFKNSFEEELKLDIKKKDIEVFDQFKQYILSWARYHFWSRCEYEIYATGVPDDEFKYAQKLDVYDQIEMNIDRITEYVMNNIK